MATKNWIILLTLMLSGRAMTLAFLGDAGGSNPGDPPEAWLMPLIGDAVIGLSALVLIWLIVKHSGLWVWTALICWNVVAIWDAMSAYVVHRTVPWPEFFMIEIFGSSMFFMASAMHLVIIVLASRQDVKQQLIGGY